MKNLLITNTYVRVISLIIVGLIIMIMLPIHKAIPEIAAEELVTFLVCMNVVNRLTKNKIFAFLIALTASLVWSYSLSELDYSTKELSVFLLVRFIPIIFFAVFTFIDHKIQKTTVTDKNNN